VEYTVVIQPVKLSSTAQSLQLPDLYRADAKTSADWTSLFLKQICADDDRLCLLSYTFVDRGQCSKKRVMQLKKT